MPGIRPLSEKQKAFAREYIIDFNATQACIRAGYSEASAADTGYQNLRNPEIMDIIGGELAMRAERTRTDADWVLRELRSIWEADITDLFNEDLTLKSIFDWPPIWRKMANALDVGQMVKKKVDSKKDMEELSKVVKTKFVDKMKALELIGKHVNVSAFKENIEAKGDFDVTWGYKVLGSDERTTPTD